MSDRQTKLQKYSAPALEKGLDILEYLSLTNSRPTLSQLAAGIDRSKSEIFRMMIVLEERGYIHRHEGDVFTLTDRLSLLGGERSDNSKLAELATPYLERLADQTELSNHLSVPQAGEFLVISSTSVSQSYGLTVQIGYKAKLFGTAAGACFLADIADKQDRREAISKHSTATDMRDFEDYDVEILRCRENGFIGLRSPETQSVFELSAPVRHLQSKQAIASVTIPYFAAELIDNRKSEIIHQLLNNVSQLQEKIAITMPKPSL